MFSKDYVKIIDIIKIQSRKIKLKLMLYTKKQDYKKQKANVIIHL